MTLRKITSLTAALSFVLMLLTSIVLYIVPQGRVAYWADWRLWGLTKTQWGDIHINVGLLFLLALGLHLYYNWKPLMAYLKDRARQMRVFTRSFNVAAIICVLTVIGTLTGIAPFSWVLDLNTAFKDAGARKYGEPPYGHAELSSLDIFAQKVGIDASLAQQRLEAAGFRVEGKAQTLQAMAAVNATTPKALYEAMRVGDDTASREKGLPETPPPGTGRFTLAALCNQYGVEVHALLVALEGKEISATEEESLRDIAQRHGMGPTDLYAAIRSAAMAIQ